MTCTVNHKRLIVLPSVAGPLDRRAPSWAIELAEGAATAGYCLWLSQQDRDPVRAVAVS